MKYFFAFALLLYCLFFLTNGDTCSSAQNADYDSTPKRLVIIKGVAKILNHPTLGETPATSETLIFQKVGCKSCYIGTNTDIDGNYKITVGDGKYKIIVRNPSSPEVDLLAPEQERYIDTGSENSPNSIFKFDIKIRLSK